jgi:hypothetical protein
MRLNIKHGGHILADRSERAVRLARTREDVRMVEDAAEAAEAMTPFDYLFQDLANDPASHLPADDPAQVVAALKALGDAMIDDATPEMNNSAIPAVYTYWGQFIDHDLTADTDRDSVISDITRPDLAPLPPGFVVENLKNLREPTLKLDSVYGGGPDGLNRDPMGAAELRDGAKLKVGTNATGAAIPGEVPPPA